MDIAQCNQQLRILRLRRRSIKIKTPRQRSVSAPTIRMQTASAPSKITTRRAAKAAQSSKTSAASKGRSRQNPPAHQELTPGRKRQSDSAQVADPDNLFMSETSSSLTRPKTAAAALLARSRRRSSNFKLLVTDGDSGEPVQNVVRIEQPVPPRAASPADITSPSPLARCQVPRLNFDTPSKRLRHDLSTISERTEVNLTRPSLEEPSTSTVGEAISTIREVVNDVTSFEEELEKTNIKLDELRTKWRQILRDEKDNIPEDILGDIDATIGKIGLLQRSKFKQYNSLIDKCKHGELDGGQTILTGDLIGYWSIVSIQLDQLDRSFEQLSILQKNSWKHPEPSKKTVVVKKKPLKTAKQPSSDAAKKRQEEARARMRAAKQAMMQRVKAQQQEQKVVETENQENTVPEERGMIC